MVVDNGGRRDEACVGDLTVLEAKAWGLAGLVIHGCHRDTEELVRIGFPVFSSGSLPAGPARLDPNGPHDLDSAQWEGFAVDKTDAVFGDADGVVFVPLKDVAEVLRMARSIWETERKQAEAIRSGKRLSEQLDFEGYLEKRARDASYTFRKHLRDRGGAIEE